MDEARRELNLPQHARARELMAQELEAESERLIRKMENVRAAMADDIAALRRMRAETDAAADEMRLMAEQKRQAEALLEEKRAELRVSLEAQELARERIDALSSAVAERDAKIAQEADALLAMEANWREAMRAHTDAEAELGRKTLALHEALSTVTRLETAVFEREESIAAQLRQIEMLEQEGRAQAGHIEALEARIHQLGERFEEARKESHALLMGLRESQLKDAQRNEALETEGDILRSKLHESERMRDRLTGQVNQLRAENAALRAEMQVKMRDLEGLNAELAANVEVLERVLASSQAQRQPVASEPARPSLRLVAEPRQRA